MQTARTGTDIPEAAKPTRSRLLFLAPSTRVRGPIGAIAETLAESLGREGYSVRLASWGRRSDHENRLARAFTWLQDMWRVRTMAAE